MLNYELIIENGVDPGHGLLTTGLRNRPTATRKEDQSATEDQGQLKGSLIQDRLDYGC